MLADLRAGIVHSFDVPVDDHRPTAGVEVLAGLVDSVHGGAASAIGVGLGGIVHEDVRVGRAPFLGWRDVDLGDLLRAATGLPVVLSNDLDALMEAEHWFGAGRDVADFATLTIGCGLVVHGRDLGLGLLGHFPLDPLGPACPDGHRGCANALLSMDAIRTQASLASGRPLEYDEVLDLAQGGDPIADQIQRTVLAALP